MAARQGAGYRRPRIPVKEKVGGDQRKPTWTANSRGAKTEMTVRPETASLGSTGEERSGDSSTTGNLGALGRIDVSGIRSGWETKGEVHS